MKIKRILSLVLVLLVLCTALTVPVSASSDEGYTIEEMTTLNSSRLYQLLFEKEYLQGLIENSNNTETIDLINSFFSYDNYENLTVFISNANTTSTTFVVQTNNYRFQMLAGTYRFYYHNTPLSTQYFLFTLYNNTSGFNVVDDFSFKYEVIQTYKSFYSLENKLLYSHDKLVHLPFYLYDGYSFPNNPMDPSNIPELPDIPLPPIPPNITDNLPPPITDIPTLEPPDLSGNWIEDLFAWFGSIFSLIKNLAQWGANAVYNVFYPVIQFFSGVFDLIRQGMLTGFEAVKITIENLSGTLPGVITNPILNFFNDIFEFTGINVFQSLFDFITNFPTTIGNFFTGLFNNITEFFADIPTGISNIITSVGNIFTEITTFFGSLFTKLNQLFIDFITFVFVPNEELFTGQFNQWSDLVEEKLPFVHQISTLLNNLVDDLETVKTVPVVKGEIMGEEYEIVNFNVIDDYIPYIHSAIIFVCYVSYALYLRHKLPSIIANK